MKNVIALLSAQKKKYTDAITVRKGEKEIWKDKHALQQRAEQHAQKQLDQWKAVHKDASAEDIQKRKEELVKLHIKYFTDQCKSQIETCDGFLREYRALEREFDLAIKKLTGGK